MIKRIVWVFLTAIVIVVAFGAEFILDLRAARRPDLATSHAFGTNISLSLIPYNKLLAEMKEQYGDRASVILTGDDRTIRVKVDGQIIREEKQPAQISDVIGLIGVGKKGAISSRFPFDIEPNLELVRPERQLADVIKNRFAKDDSHTDFFSFSDNQWMIGDCQKMAPASGLAKIGISSVVETGTSCIVRWKGSLPATMLVNVSIAKGDPWLRPFARRFCRSVIETALEKIGTDRPDYAACILIDRPARLSASQSLVSYVYAVDGDGRLALIE